MPLINVIDRDGKDHVLEARAGLRLMEVLRELEHGVAAICGGMCSCATCHVYVDAEWLQALPQPEWEERELLSALANSREESRLSCQIEFTEALSGLTVIIAPDE